MKTKIVYISGGEIFDIADVRDAFNQVRETLGLADDTVMFGIPVDADDALADVTPATNTVNTVAQMHTENDPAVEVNAPQMQCAQIIDISQHTEITEDKPISEPVAPISNMEQPQEIEEPAPVKRVATKRKSQKKISQEPIEQTPQQPTENIDAAPIVPILSVLATNSETQAEQENEISDKEIDIIEEDISADIEQETITEETIEEIETSVELNEESIEENTPVVIREVTNIHVVDEMITPTAIGNEEKTLEELLESMAPLREDNISNENATDDIPGEIIEQEMPSIDDEDATLEKLASEFAKNQDTIHAPKKGDAHGKIGKLKNILPFKKVKRDDTGLMGDLFGWAGIAANDEDFSIPGFFTTAASKK